MRTPPDLGFSGRKAEQNNIVINNGDDFWPDIAVSDFQSQRNIPFDIESNVLVNALLNAIAEINQDLSNVVSAKISAGYSTSLDVPGSTANGINQITAQYKKAVFARAKADLIGEFASIGRRDSHPGQESDQTRTSLLAEAATTIRSIKGLPRAGVHLL